MAMFVIPGYGLEGSAFCKYDVLIEVQVLAAIDGIYPGPEEGACEYPSNIFWKILRQTCRRIYDEDTNQPLQQKSHALKKTLSPSHSIKRRFGVILGVRAASTHTNRAR